MFEKWGIAAAVLGPYAAGAVAYVALVYVCTWGIEGFHRWRYRNEEGARRFLKRFKHPAFPPKGGFQTLEEIHKWSRSGWLLMGFGLHGIYKNLKLIEGGKPQWLYLSLVLTLPFFTALPRACYRTAKRVFNELGIESLNELSATDGPEREKAAS
jgi:hypothetical protein